QLGCEPTKEASWRAAREWWNKKQIEIDAEPSADDDHRQMEAYARMAEITDQCMNGTLPDEVSEAIRGKARLQELRRKTLALFERADPARTIGYKADAWCQSLMAGVEDGCIHVSRYGSYKRDVATFTEWIGENSDLGSIDEDAL